jgi:hypothetical protein
MAIAAPLAPAAVLAARPAGDTHHDFVQLARPAGHDGDDFVYEFAWYDTAKSREIRVLERSDPMMWD